MTERRSLRVAARIGLLGAAFVALVVAVLIASGRTPIEDLIVPGGKDLPPAEAVVLRQDFGPRALGNEYHYDGVEYYIAAREFPDLRAAAAHLDDPRLRLQRILGPAVASLGGEGDAVILILLGLNLLGIGLACGSLADLLDRHGHRAELALLAVLPLLAPVVSSTSEPLAFGAAFLGVTLLDRGRLVAGVVALVLATLTRETSITVAMGAALGFCGRQQFRPAVMAAAAPLLVGGGWYAFLALYLGGRTQEIGLLGIAHVGPSTIVLTVGVALLTGVGLWWWRDAGLVWPVAALYLIWPLIYSPEELTWRGQIRVSAPPIILGLIAVASLATERRSPVVGRFRRPPEPESVARSASAP